MSGDGRLLSSEKIKTIILMALSQRFSQRQIAAHLNIARSTVTRVLSRMLETGTVERQVAGAATKYLDMSNEQVMQTCYPNLRSSADQSPGELTARRCLVPDFARLARDNQNKNLAGI